MGNKRFRERINATIKNYIDAPNRYEKSLVVHGVVEQIQASGGRFLKYDDKSGSWYELSSAQMKEKVGHAIRDAVNALEARAERKRVSDIKEEREPGTTSPAPAVSVRDKESPLGARGYPLNMPDTQPPFHPQSRSQKAAAFEPSQSMLFHQRSPSDRQRPYTFPPIPFPQRYHHPVNRQEEYQHSPRLHHDGAVFDQHHPTLIEPIPYPPVTSELATKTSEGHQVVPSDAGTTIETARSVGEENDYDASQQEKDPFMEQINQVLGPIVDDADSCVSV